MNWSLVGGICASVAVILVLVLGVLFIRWNRRFNEEKRREEEKLEREGKVVLAWIVVANNALHEPNHADDYSYAVVVFTRNQDLPDMEGTLEQIAGKIVNFEAQEHPDEDERIIASVMRTHVPYLSRPLRIPARVTGGLEAYCASIRVHWKLLPARRLSLPYVYCRAAIGEDGSTVQVKYPALARRARRSE
jgi:hypothetical protein